MLYSSHRLKHLHLFTWFGLIFLFSVFTTSCNSGETFNQNDSNPYFFPEILTSTLNAPTYQGGTGNFTVKMKTNPGENVVVNLSTSDSSKGAVFPDSLNFGTDNYDQLQTVKITGAKCDTLAGEDNYTISLTPAGNNYGAAQATTVSVQNIETPGIVVSVTDNETSEAGGTATFTVRLCSQPSSTLPSNSVTLTVYSTDVREGSVSATNSLNLTFTDTTWNTPQTVTVTGVDDTVIDPAQPYSVVIQAPPEYADMRAFPSNIVTLLNFNND